MGSIPAAFMYDAAGNRSEDCTYQVQQKKQTKKTDDTIYTYDLTLIVDEAYLIRFLRQTHY